MASKLTLAIFVTTAAFAASQACAQGTNTTQSIAPVANTTAKQDKRPVTTTAAPKAGPTRAEKKPATAAAKPAVATPTLQQPAANPQTAKKDVPRIQSNPLGRVSVDNQGSTFGFSSDTKMKMYETPDGSRIRGMDHAITSNRQPNYFGLSLSVPTTGTSSGDSAPGLLPLPLPPRN